MSAAAVFLETRKLQPRVSIELKNFFESAESDFGLSSNFTPIINRAQSGGGGSGSGTNLACARMANRLRLKNELKDGQFVDSQVAIQRAVRTALMRLCPVHLDVLVRRHKQVQWLPELVRAFGDVAGVVVLTGEATRRYAAALKGAWPAARGKCPDSLESFLLQAAQAYDETVVDAVIEDAETMVLDAHDAYAKERAPERGSRGCGAFQRRAPRQAALRSVKHHFNPTGWRP
jgi:hypothetical protein